MVFIYFMLPDLRSTQYDDFPKPYQKQILFAKEVLLFFLSCRKAVSSYGNGNQVFKNLLLGWYGFAMCN